MKGISINGVEYLPASTLAKQFRYTTDYIGQLCRARKIDAQLVGRSWYVNPVSLTSHKKKRYIKTIPNDKTSEKAELITLSRLEVKSVDKKNTVKLSQSLSNNFEKHIDWKPLKYEADSADLMPKFGDEKKTSKILVDLADSTEIAVKTEGRTIGMVAEELPIVSLKGKLKVSSANDSFDNDTLMVKESDVPLPPIPRPPRNSEISPKSIHLSLSRSEMGQEIKPRIKEIIATPEITNTSSLFVPKSVASRIVVGDELEINLVEVALITTSGFLIIFLVLIFFGEVSVEADALNYSWGINFSTQSLSAFVYLFSH